MMWTSLSWWCVPIVEIVWLRESYDGSILGDGNILLKYYPDNILLLKYYLDKIILLYQLNLDNIIYIMARPIVISRAIREQHHGRSIKLWFRQDLQFGRRKSSCDTSNGTAFIYASIVNWHHVCRYFDGRYFGDLQSICTDVNSALCGHSAFCFWGALYHEALQQPGVRRWRMDFYVRPMPRHGQDCPNGSLLWLRYQDLYYCPQCVRTIVQERKKCGL